MNGRLKQVIYAHIPRSPSVELPVNCITSEKTIPSPIEVIFILCHLAHTKVQARRYCSASECGQLLLKHQDTRLLAQHTLEHSKGKIVMNNHHRRDTTSKIKALQEELCRQFSDQQKAGLFLEMIHHRFPRYPRDQFQHIHKSNSGRPTQLIDNVLEYCVEHHLFSSGEYHDVLQRFGKTQEKKRDVVLKEFRPITPLGDLDLIFALTPESSKITVYEQLMN